MNTVEENIRKIRELKNYTQEYMAERLGITQAAYSKIENSDTKLSYSKVESIAKILEVEIQELIAFDSQKYFNSFNNVKGSNNGSINISMNLDDLKSLYEDKINLLEKLLYEKEEELKKIKENK